MNAGARSDDVDDVVAPTSATAASSRDRDGGNRSHQSTRADMLKFQVYIRQRLAELNERMPARLGTREEAELMFLEQEVVQDRMSSKKRQLRDPLHGTPLSAIDHTNLNLLSRFVSEAGAILPRKLTGVTPKKQRRLAKALKRAHMLALLPRTWKRKEYINASYADGFSKPRVEGPMRGEDDEFREPPDIRFPNRFDRKPPLLSLVSRNPR